jgi:hypothetical protein
MSGFREKKWIIYLAGFLGVVLLGSLFFWYRSTHEDERDQKTDNGEVIEEQSLSEKIFSQDENEEKEGDDGEVVETSEEARASEAYVVDAEICNEECEVYKDNPEGLSYCQAVCGLAPEGTNRPRPTSCEEVVGTAKDICYRDKAVATKDVSECEKITDKNLRKSCQNRIAEDFFDE